jgi:hypothetical protein
MAAASRSRHDRSAASSSAAGAPSAGAPGRQRDTVASSGGGDTVGCGVALLTGAAASVVESSQTGQSRCAPLPARAPSASRTGTQPPPQQGLRTRSTSALRGGAWHGGGGWLHGQHLSGAATTTTTTTTLQQAWQCEGGGVVHHPKWGKRVYAHATKWGW